MRQTKQLAEELGWEYELWDWDKLTSIYGAYMFKNFRIGHVARCVYALLVRYYTWQVLAASKYATTVFLDGEQELTHDHLAFIANSDYDIVLGKENDPGFIVCRNHKAAVLARNETREDLNRRYRACGKHMFDFLADSMKRIFGKQFLFLTMIPLWKFHELTVRNLDTDTPDEDTSEPKTEFIPYVSNDIVLSKQTAIKRRELKAGAITAIVPPLTQRIIVMGKDCMGLTDVHTFVQPGDTVIHFNECSYYKEASSVNDVTNIIFYDKQTKLPMFIRESEELMKSAQQLFPGSSFNGYLWRERVASSITMPVALACSYKEINSNLQVILYGYNVADDCTTGVDSELEELILQETNVDAYTPSYEVLYLILTTAANKMQWIIAESSWIKKMERTHHTWRFAYPFVKTQIPTALDHAWALPTTKLSTDLTSRDNVLAAVRNAARMKFDYVYICADTATPDPLEVWKSILEKKPKAIGNRYYDVQNNLWKLSLTQGTCLSRETSDIFLKFLKQNTEEQDAEHILAEALRQNGIAVEKS